MKYLLTASVLISVSLIFVSCSQATPPVPQSGIVIGSQISSGSMEYIQPVPTSGMRN